MRCRGTSCQQGTLPCQEDCDIQDNEAVVSRLLAAALAVAITFTIAALGAWFL